MMRGTFGNVAIKNLMIPGETRRLAPRGRITIHQPSGEQNAIYEAAMKYIAEGVPTVVFGGEDTARQLARLGGKGPCCPPRCAPVIVKSFERIHRSTSSDGVLPFQFQGQRTPPRRWASKGRNHRLRGVEGEIQAGSRTPRW